MSAAVGESALMLPSLGLVLFFACHQRLLSHLVLDPQALEVIARGILRVLRGLRGERKRPLPNRIDRRADLGREAHESS
jgi:hypothetical protein